MSLNKAQTTGTAISISIRLLNLSIRLWCLVAFIGLGLFAYYIASFYGGTVWSGEFEAWGEVSLKGHVKGDWLGNSFFISHMFMAVIITLGGVIQLIPLVRRKALFIHRWNGRLFIITAFLISLGGLYLVWVRGSVLTIVGAIAITINALLIFYCGFKAWVTARQHDVKSHRRWALRTFVVTNGVWFFRVGFMAWIVINQGPVGSTDNLDGPFDYVWAFCNFLLPLAILEGYFLANDGSNRTLRYIMTSIIFLFTIVTVVGIFGAYMFMWQPNL